MAYKPIGGSLQQFARNAAGASASTYYLKGYVSGTDTPLSMGIDATPSSTLAKCALNSRGEPISNDADENSWFVPHFNEPYRLALYANAIDADNNTLASAVWDVDGLNLDFDATSLSVTVNGLQRTSVESYLNNKEVADYTALRANLSLDVYSLGDVVHVTDDRVQRGWGVVESIGSYVDNGATIGNVITGGSYAWIRHEDRVVLYDKEWGSVNDFGTTDDSAALDAMLQYVWDNIPSKFLIKFTDGLTLDKAGDFTFPPNCTVEGNVDFSRVYIGNQLTRWVFKRDNTRVDPSYQTDAGYWGLGPNVVRKTKFVVKSSVTTHNEAVLVSDMPAFSTRECEWSDAKTTVQIHFQNDDYFTEFWDIEAFLGGNTTLMKFSKTATGSGTASFGHGKFKGKLDIRTSNTTAKAIHIDGANGGADPYNSQWQGQGFVGILGSGSVSDVCSLFYVENGGKLNYTSIDITTENLGLTPTVGPYLINVDTASSGTANYNQCRFHGNGELSKFKGVNANNDIQIIGGHMIDSAGTDVFQGNQLFKIVTEESDVNGDNLLRLANEKVFVYQWAGAVLANARAGILPISFNRTVISSIQVFCETPPSGNTGGVWHLGIRRQGTTNPTTSVTVGETANLGASRIDYHDIFYSVPSLWRNSPANDLIWRNTSGSGNDGTGPSDVTIVIKYYEM